MVEETKTKRIVSKDIVPARCREKIEDEELKEFFTTGIIGFFVRPILALLKLCSRLVIWGITLVVVAIAFSYFGFTGAFVALIFMLGIFSEWI